MNLLGHDATYLIDVHCTRPNSGREWPYSAILARIRSLWYIILATAGQNKITWPEFGHSGQNTVLFASFTKM